MNPADVSARLSLMRSSSPKQPPVGASHLPTGLLNPHPTSLVKDKSSQVLRLQGFKESSQADVSARLSLMGSSSPKQPPVGANHLPTGLPYRPRSVILTRLKQCQLYFRFICSGSALLFSLPLSFAVWFVFDLVRQGAGSYPERGSADFGLSQ